MQPPSISSWSLARLRRSLQERKFAIPKLQRNFVWDPSRAAKLLDSMYRDMPIGSVCLWEMDRKSANLIRQSSNVLPSFNTTHRHIWFVIDGQQRLSVIYQAFEGQQRTNDRGRDIDFGRLCFVVHPARDTGDTPRIVYRKPVDGELVPLCDILAPDWRRLMPKHSQRFLRSIRDCRSRLLRYPLPIVVVRSATLEEIGEVFIRVNSQGMTVTSADRAIALMGNLDVRSMAVELRERLREERFDLPSIDPILMGFNLVAEKQKRGGDPPKPETMARRWSREINNDERRKRDFRSIWDRYRKAFLAGTDYLRLKFPVYDESYLPSGNMLATLAVFFYHHPGRPSRAQAVEIRKWFWTTGVAQRYTGRGYHQNIVGDALFFQDLAAGKRARFRFKERLDPVLDIQAAQYASRSARTRVFFCLLASLRPRYLEDGDYLSVDKGVLSHSNTKHRHHIFPKAQMAKRFTARTYNSLVNICYLVSRDNQAIGMKLPRKYLAGYRDAGRGRFGTVMKSHLIPVSDESGVWESGIAVAFKKFRRQRLKLICREFERAAGIKLFTKP